ncbi:MAG: iron-sulfur cluster insertion protein ErpA [Anaerolineales bacterium]|nr:iron-sulfur cluster insertion protein ErpA [Anaerolineales bacterium]
MVEETVTTTQEVIYLTDAAVSVVKNLLVQKNVPDYGLRVFVSGGGCSGLQYGMALEPEARPYDNVIEKDGIKVFVDPTSMMYLNQATIDYEDNLMGGGFKIENPNAVSSCGCGHSFKPQGHGYDGGASCGSGGCGCG